MHKSDEQTQHAKGDCRKKRQSPFHFHLPHIRQSGQTSVRLKWISPAVRKTAIQITLKSIEKYSVSFEIVSPVSWAKQLQIQNLEILPFSIFSTDSITDVRIVPNVGHKMPSVIAAEVFSSPICVSMFGFQAAKKR